MRYKVIGNPEVDAMNDESVIFDTFEEAMEQIMDWKIIDLEVDGYPQEYHIIPVE